MSSYTPSPFTCEVENCTRIWCLNKMDPRCADMREGTKKAKIEIWKDKSVVASKPHKKAIPIEKFIEDLDDEPAIVDAVEPKVTAVTQPQGEDERVILEAAQPPTITPTSTINKTGERFQPK